MQTSLSHGILRWLAGGADDGGRAMPSLMLATISVLGLTAWLVAKRPFVADVVYPRAGCDEPRGVYSDAGGRTEFACVSHSPMVDRSRPAPAEANECVPTDAVPQTLLAYITAIPPESAENQRERHEKIARRRAGPLVIVHRGAWEFAPENTLEAYAAAMDCGADGCEVDIRRTADGVLVMFHDDGLDRMSDSFGGVNEYTFAELQAVEFRSVYGPDPST